MYNRYPATPEQYNTSFDWLNLSKQSFSLANEGNLYVYRRDSYSEYSGQIDDICVIAIFSVEMTPVH